ncbi:MAG: hypothetical protein LBT59_05810, partial [Clostridiales bacterium]|nr:hypothetical protein [Clostridiales bacterium]
MENASNENRNQRFWTRKKKLGVIALLGLILAISGATYAWFTSRGILTGGAMALERIKIEATGLMKATGVDQATGEVQWQKLAYSAENPAQLNLEEILSASRLIASAGALEAVATDKKMEALGSTFKYSIENLGDEAYVYVDMGQLVGVELATNAWEVSPGIQKDLVGYDPAYYTDGGAGTYPADPRYPWAVRSHVWFEDLQDYYVSGSALLIEDIGSYIASDAALLTKGTVANSTTPLLAALNSARINFESTTSYVVDGTTYYTFESFEKAVNQLIEASKQEPGNRALAAQAVAAAEQLQIARNSTDVSARERFDTLITQYYDVMVLQAAFADAEAATGKEAVVYNGYLNAYDPLPRP